MDSVLALGCELGARMSGWLVKNPASGEYRLDREVFTDAALFELEMRHIFEGNWIYLAHESQIDYVQYDHCLAGLNAYRSLVHLRGKGYGEALCLVRGTLPAELADPDA